MMALSTLFRTLVRRSAMVALSAPAVLVACSSDKTGSQAATTYAFSIDFQSKDAAISVDTVHIEVYDAKSTCSSLTLKRTSGGQLPTPVAQIDPVNVCDLLASKGGVVEVPYGTFSILVVASRSGKDWLIGCASEQVGPQSGSPPTITLSNFDNSVNVPLSPCPNVTAHCAQQC